MADIKIIDLHQHIYDRNKNASPMMENGTIVHEMPMGVATRAA